MVLELVRVMVIFVAPPGSIVPGPKLLATVGDAIAVSVAVAAVPVPALVVDIVPVLFKYSPATVAVTGTTTEQLPDAGMVPPERASELPPLVIVTAPPQVLDEGVPAVFRILAEG